MKPKFLLPLPNHPELIDADKTRYKNVVQWRHEQAYGKGRFLERDRLVRSATRSVPDFNNSGDRKFRGAVIGLCLIAIAVFVAVLELGILDQVYINLFLK